MKKVLLLLNPKSRSGERAFDEAMNWLKTSGYEVLTSSPNNESNVHDLIEQHKNQLDFVVVGGGDGSVNHVLPSLVKTHLPLVLIPLGTANNLARTYQIPNNVPEALSLLETGSVREVDLGVINNIYFANVAGLGLSTEVNRKVTHWLKKHLGVFAFILTALQLGPKIRPFIADISCGSKKIKSISWQISVCNGKHYGSGLTIQENASLEDGILHCLSTEVRRWWHSFKLFPALLTGRYRKDHDVTLLAGPEILIETNRKLRIDVDGDIKTSTPATIRVQPRALKLIVPATAPQF